MAVKSSSGPYVSKGMVGTMKSGYSNDSILRSMLASKKHRTYDRKEEPRKGNEDKARLRREKKRKLRLAKKQQ